MRAISSGSESLQQRQDDVQRHISRNSGTDPCQGTLLVYRGFTGLNQVCKWYIRLQLSYIKRRDSRSLLGFTPRAVCTFNYLHTAPGYMLTEMVTGFLQPLRLHAAADTLCVMRARAGHFCLAVSSDFKAQSQIAVAPCSARQQWSFQKSGP